MKGTILDFLKLTTEKPELARELLELATKYEFEFTDEVSDIELDGVAGGYTFVSSFNTIITTTGQVLGGRGPLPPPPLPTPGPLLP